MKKNEAVANAFPTSEIMTTPINKTLREMLANGVWRGVDHVRHCPGIHGALDLDMLYHGPNDLVFFICEDSKASVLQ